MSSTTDSTNSSKWQSWLSSGNAPLYMAWELMSPEKKVREAAQGKLEQLKSFLDAEGTASPLASRWQEVAQNAMEHGNNALQDAGVALVQVLTTDISKLNDSPATGYLLSAGIHFETAEKAAEQGLALFQQN